ncbi:transposable element Tc3 transposase [Trichonephila clavipes]|nr:transposable element Tc3 transposase [Trichonephila clavipes]
MDWPTRSPDLNPIEHVWNFLGRCLAARTLPPVTIRELRFSLQDEWAAMPQQLIDTLILSMGRRCETCLAQFIITAPDLAPSDFHLFLALKKTLARRRFGSNAEVKQAVKRFFRMKSPEFFSWRCFYACQANTPSGGTVRIMRAHISPCLIKIGRSVQRAVHSHTDFFHLECLRAFVEKRKCVKTRISESVSSFASSSVKRAPKPTRE